MNANCSRLRSLPGWSITCVKITELTPSAKAKDRITVAITYSGITTARSSTIRISRISTSPIGRISRVSRSQRLARVVGLGDLAADQHRCAAGRRARARGADPGTVSVASSENGSNFR